MALLEDVESDINSYLSGRYEVQHGFAIPNVEDVKFGKMGKELEMSMLFIDIHNSTDIVDSFRRQTAAKMYKSFLAGATRIARFNSGEMLSFNGDGVLVGFVGDQRREEAVLAAHHMVHFGNYILKPKLELVFSANNQASALKFDFGIGIATGTILAVRAGMRGENNSDLVWVGNPTNHAAKLAGESYFPFNIRVCWDTFWNLPPNWKTHFPSGKAVWEPIISDKLKDLVCQSNWYTNLPSEPKVDFSTLLKGLSPLTPPTGKTLGELYGVPAKAPAYDSTLAGMILAGLLKPRM